MIIFWRWEWFWRADGEVNYQGHRRRREGEEEEGEMEPPRPVWWGFPTTIESNRLVAIRCEPR